MFENTASATAPNKPSQKPKKRFKPSVIKAWCKTCGICSSFCPRKVLRCDDTGIHVDHPEACIGCRFCELHCPDLAISIKELEPEKGGPQE